jgi:hypothetical protein
MSRNSGSLIGWWIFLLIGAAAALLVAWLARVVSVPLTTLLAAGAVVIGLSWLIVLVTVPWNLYFAARRAVAAMAVSRERGISVRPDDDAEAGQISRRMLRFALAAHLGTAMAAAVIAYASGDRVGYYVAGFFLLSTAFRPAAAYFWHVRERIGVLNRESTHPRDDIATLRQKVDTIDELRRDLLDADVDLRRTESALRDEIARTRQLMTTDLTRLEDAQAADRTAARSRDEELGRRIGDMVRRIETTLDGLSDHQELLTGLRALVRMVRSDQA